MKIYRVIVEDLTNLGGPMGSEYTTTIETKLFLKKEKAQEWIEKDMQRRNLQKPWKAPRSYVDKLSVGYGISLVTVIE